MNNKLEDAYRSIGEVAKILNLINKKTGKLNTHTIRFWEKEFKQIKPLTLNGNRRYYSEKDVDIIKIIYQLLKKQGYTIPGVKKLLKESSVKLDDDLDLSIKRQNFKSSLKFKAEKIKVILDKIKKIKNG